MELPSKITFFFAQRVSVESTNFLIAVSTSFPLIMRMIMMMMKDVFIKWLNGKKNVVELFYFRRRS